MSTLFKNASVVNVFTGQVEKKNVLVEDDKIIGVDCYEDADTIVDLSGKYICPAFIDGHIHIESSMLTPEGFARAAVPHGTSAIIADPHEIANVCGIAGIDYMKEGSMGLPMEVYFALPSCVPATPYDEAGAVLHARELDRFYEDDHVVSLGEVMNYVGVVKGDSDLLEKISHAQNKHKIINGHAPMLSGKSLDQYISAGISDDHETSSMEEAVERISKGQWIMIRQGTAAKNLNALIDLFDEPYYHRCMLVTDDKHPVDLINNGHIDSIIRQAVQLGKPAIRGIQLATIQPAQYYGLNNMGAVAPGYYADFLVLNDLDTIDIKDVYHRGKMVVKNKKILKFEKPKIDPILKKFARRSFFMQTLKEEDFIMEPMAKYNHVIEVIAGALITNHLIMDIDFEHKNGIDLENDILKIAVCERHHKTGHIGLGFIKGIGIKEGAIASSVSHDSHNLIIIGTNEADMALAGNKCKSAGGGLFVVKDGEVIASLPLKVAGLMSEESASKVSKLNSEVREAVYSLGADQDKSPFMHMAFVSLSVIPHLKITTLGLFDVNEQEYVE